MTKTLSPHRLFIIACTAALALASCSKEDVPGSDGGDNDAQPLTGIIASIGAAESRSRAEVSLTDPDYIGRKAFTDGDDIVFTYIGRTTNPISNFTYEGIAWHRADDSWMRIMSEGSPERVYWSDSRNYHTFTAYSLPQQSAGSTFDWELRSDGCYYGTIGPADNATDSVSFASRYTAGDIAPADSGSLKLSREDLVLHHSTTMQAQPGGSVALVQFAHALSFVQVVVNINGFSAASDAADNHARVWDLTLMNQPIDYYWDMKSDKAKPLPGSRTKHFKACTFFPEGKDNNQYRQFVYNTLAVPTTDEGRTITVKFKVTYPDPLNPDTKTITRTYVATKDAVKFYAGKRTIVKISLNHQNEGITVGAEYGDWEAVQTIDNGSLSKKSTFLDTTSRDSVTIHTDAAATATDATWLYYKRDAAGNIVQEDGYDVIYDIYGHKGRTPDDAYVISTARQLLSFAYEVKNGFTFGDAKPKSYSYVRLDASIHLQPEFYADVNKAKENPSKLLKWIGIGDASHQFNGRFDGGKRGISNLYGAPLFASVDDKGMVEKLILDYVIEVNGNGALAETNLGIVAGIVIKGDVVGTNATAYSGSVVGTNDDGLVLACTHNGKVEAPDLVAGIVGQNTNNGHIVACYHTGKVVASSGGESPQVGGVVAHSDHNLVFGAYYNSDFLTPTISYQSGAKTTKQMQMPDFVVELNQSIKNFYDTYYDRMPEGDTRKQVFEYLLSNYKFKYIPAYYPEPQ